MSNALTADFTLGDAPDEDDPLTADFSTGQTVGETVGQDPNEIAGATWAYTDVGPAVQTLTTTQDAYPLVIASPSIDASAFIEVRYSAFARAGIDTYGRLVTVDREAIPTPASTTSTERGPPNSHVRRLADGGTAVLPTRTANEHTGTLTAPYVDAIKSPATDYTAALLDAILSGDGLAETGYDLTALTARLRAFDLVSDPIVGDALAALLDAGQRQTESFVADFVSALRGGFTAGDVRKIMQYIQPRGEIISGRKIRAYGNSEAVSGVVSTGGYVGGSFGVAITYPDLAAYDARGRQRAYRLAFLSGVSLYQDYFGSVYEQRPALGETRSRPITDDIYTDGLATGSPVAASPLNATYPGAVAIALSMGPTAAKTLYGIGIATGRGFDYSRTDDLYTGAHLDADTFALVRGPEDTHLIAVCDGDVYALLWGSALDIEGRYNSGIWVRQGVRVGDRSVWVSTGDPDSGLSL